MSNELTTDQAPNVRALVEKPAYQKRFEEVLGKRAPQFLSSLITLSNDTNLAQCEPNSMVSGAMIAATLDLPLEKQLGFAHLVPYRGKDGVQRAQFQIGYKGYIQLAHRSGQYAKMNARVVNAEAFDGYDEVGEPKINWAKLDETLSAIGCVFAFQLINGFTKVCFWSKEKIEAHAARFSAAVKYKKQDSPWFTNPDAMWKKTLIINELRAWGILSVQMEKAMRFDQSVVKGDVVADDLNADYVDNPERQGEETPKQERQPRPKIDRGAQAMKNVTPEKKVEPEPEKPAEKPAEPEPKKEPAPAPEPEAPKVVVTATAGDGLDLQPEDEPEKEPEKAPEPEKPAVPVLRIIGEISKTAVRKTKNPQFPLVRLFDITTEKAKVVANVIWDPERPEPKVLAVVSKDQAEFVIEKRGEQLFCVDVFPVKKVAF
jgi:recombination protein RecT